LGSILQHEEIGKQKNVTEVWRLTTQQPICISPNFYRILLVKFCSNNELIQSFLLQLRNKLKKRERERRNKMSKKSGE